MISLLNLSSHHGRLTLAIALLSTIIVSCKKEAKDSKYPIQMTFDTLEPSAEMRFFIGETEIDPQYNKVAVQGFLDRYYIEKTATGIINYQSKFNEPEEDSYSNSSFTFNAEDDIKYAADIIETRKEDDVTIMKSRVTNKIDDVSIVKSDLFKYKFDLNPDGTYNYQYVVHEYDGSLDVSLLYYKLVRYDDDGNRKELAFGTVHNQFNEAFIKTLAAHDTLAVKEYRLKYSVK